MKLLHLNLVKIKTKLLDIWIEVVTPLGVYIRDINTQEATPGNVGLDGNAQRLIRIIAILTTSLFQFNLHNTNNISQRIVRRHLTGGFDTPKWPKIDRSPATSSPPVRSRTCWLDDDEMGCRLIRDCYCIFWWAMTLSWDTVFAGGGWTGNAMASSKPRP